MRWRPDTPPTRTPEERPGSASRSGGMRMLAELEDVARTERSRLADAIHDDALQLLAVAHQDVLDGMDDIPQRERIVAVLDETRRALRAVVASMDEPTLDDLPLGDALERLGASIARRARFALTVQADDDASGIHDAAVRGWVRELLTNAAKHAAATEVGVEVAATADTVRVLVRDDGRGYEGDEVRRAHEAGHVGLRRLERAARLLGGEFTLSREEDETVARVTLPRAALVQQRRTEDELGAERRWSAGLVAAFQDALMVVRDGRVVQCNDALERLCGLDAHALRDAVAPAFPFWAPPDRLANARQFDRIVARGDGEAVIAMTRADGSTFNALWVVQRVDDGMGGGLGSLVVVRDLTEREQAFERAQLRTELETTIETTHRLARILEAAGEGREPMYRALGDVLHGHLGWLDFVVNVRRGDEWIVEWTSPGEASVLMGERYEDESFRSVMDPRFDRGGVFYSLEEDAVETPGLTVVVGSPDAMAADDVRPGDMLLVPVRGAGGRDRAIISVDRPRTGRRPTGTQLAALAAIASHVGVAFDLLDRWGHDR